jgi:cell division protein FtsI/penicillin-binding protein 2
MLRKRRRYKRPELSSQAIPAKANVVLNVILVMLFLIVLRIWHLAVVQYDDKVEESRKPQRRIVIEPARRGTIRDRFNIPLALNKIQYNVAILYSQLRQVPSIAWETPGGVRKKVFKRKQYITALSILLGKELQMDPERIEDLIYSKASYYSNIPFVIKEDISEKEYYRLKMLEKDWLGIEVQRIPRRSYPLGKTAGDIIGYMGAIDRKQYDAIVNETKVLEGYISERENGEDPPLPEGMQSPEEVRARLKDLEEKSYTINDYVGKAGVEGRFEEVLRGFHGKKIFYSDARGNFLRELPGLREPLSGQRLVLTISAELQQYAEQLLAQNERIREARVSGIDAAQQALLSLKQPWIKGGAILAMDPKNGEILAMASYPRFDPNDFVLSGNPEISQKKRAEIHRWFETESYLSDLWDEKRPLERERYHDGNAEFYEEKQILSWKFWIDQILPVHSPIKESLIRLNKVAKTVQMLETVNELIALTGQANIYWLLNLLYKDPPHKAYGAKPPQAIADGLLEIWKKDGEAIASAKRRLNRYLESIPNNYDKALFIDLARISIDETRFSKNLLEKMGHLSLDEYKRTCGAYAYLNDVLYGMTKELYHTLHFKPWRKNNEKMWLKNIRAQEKAKKQYPKPYIDYFDQLESQMFKEFWEQHRWRLMQAFLKGLDNEEVSEELHPYIDHLLGWYQEIANGAHQEIEWRTAYGILKKTIADLDPSNSVEFLRSLRGYRELSRPLLGKYRQIRRSTEGIQQEKHLAAAFYPLHGFGYGRSQAYRQSATQGSLFKLVTAYTALIQRYRELGVNEPSAMQLNPLVIVDRIFRNGKELCVACTEEGKPIPRYYKGGRLPKSTHSIGKIDLIHAIETSSNPYFSLLAGDYLNDPEDLSKNAALFSYGAKTGIDLPAEIPGKMPSDLKSNRTGLYSMAIGQHSLVVTPLQTAVMLSSIANGGKVVVPKIVSLTAGRHPSREEIAFHHTQEFSYKNTLSLVGIDFPLFSAAHQKEKRNLINRNPTKIKRELFMPAVVRKILLDSMHKVVIRTQDESLASLSKFYKDYPEAISDYIDLKNDFTGKTSTAESKETIDLDLEHGTNTYTHVWFGGISFSSKKGPDNRTTFVFRDRFGKPELVVVVYFRFGVYGKEAAPPAAQMVRKWREIKEARMYK